MALTALAAGVAATHDGADRADSYRAGAATILLLLGLAVAVVLGATAVNREAESGFLGLLVGAGLPRRDLAVARLGARLVALLAVVAVWGIAFQAGSLVLGPRPGRAARRAHALDGREPDPGRWSAAAAVSTVLGPLVSGIVGVGVFVVAQAVVNLKAAADQSLIGAVARPIVRTAYYVFPRAVTSPMIVDLQARGQGSAAAPRAGDQRRARPRAGRRVGHDPLDAALVRPVRRPGRDRPAPAAPSRSASSSGCRPGKPASISCQNPMLPLADAPAQVDVAVLPPGAEVAEPLVEVAHHDAPGLDLAQAAAEDQRRLGVAGPTPAAAVGRRVLLGHLGGLVVARGCRGRRAWRR